MSSVIYLYNGIAPQALFTIALSFVHLCQNDPPCNVVYLRCCKLDCTACSTVFSWSLSIFFTPAWPQGQLPRLTGGAVQANQANQIKSNPRPYTKQVVQVCGSPPFQYPIFTKSFERDAQSIKYFFDNIWSLYKLLNQQIVDSGSELKLIFQPRQKILRDFETKV